MGSYPFGGISHLRVGFTLRCFQRLSLQTWLPSCATGVTTGAPEVCPSRSSRTKDSSLQISCARDR